MLIVENITKSYPTQRGSLTVLRDCSFTLQPGESLAVVGPSGSGKSTLLSILGTLEQPDSGTFELNGASPMQMSETQKAAFRRDKIGFVFQDHHLLPQCRALENVLVPFLADGSVSESDAEYAKKLLVRCGLADRLEHHPAELSGGERQRVAIARALVRRPSLLLADEPTGNLDHDTAVTIGELLLELSSEKDQPMLVLVTHDRELAAKMKYQKELREGALQMIRT